MKSKELGQIDILLPPLLGGRISPKLGMQLVFQCQTTKDSLQVLEE